MAEIVFGLATSHSPQLSVPWSSWSLLRKKDETDSRLDYAALAQRAKPGIEQELTEEIWHQRYETCQHAITTLAARLRAARPDAIVMLGDDQHEQFLDDNLPALAIYHGDSVQVAEHVGDGAAPWKRAEEKGWAETASEYPAAAGLGEHLVRVLSEEEFDVARCNQLRKTVGLGHAFAFLYRRFWSDATVPPMVPIMINTYYPPNQPTPRRCYTLGQALRRAIESWEDGRRVAVMASGGLSHVVIDEELDRMVLDAMLAKHTEGLCSLPRARLRGGTSETLAWLALAGATEPMEMELLSYMPAYRSPAGTGCGIAFACWS